MAQYLNTISISALLCMSLPAVAAGISNDPTQPPADLSSISAAETRASTSQIQSITINKKQRYAMINGDMVKVGDTINAGRIVQITENGVWVKSGNEVSHLPMFPNVTKRNRTTTKHTSKHPTIRKHP